MPSVTKQGMVEIKQRLGYRLRHRASTAVSTSIVLPRFSDKATDWVSASMANWHYMGRVAAPYLLFKRPRLPSQRSLSGQRADRHAAA